MSDYYVDPRVRLRHQAYINRTQWDYVNTLSPDYPDLMAIKDKYPDISVNAANAMVKRHNPAQTSPPNNDKGVI